MDVEYDKSLVLVSTAGKRHGAFFVRLQTPQSDSWCMYVCLLCKSMAHSLIFRRTPDDSRLCSIFLLLYIHANGDCVSQMTTEGVVGSAVAIIGTLLYSLAKQKYGGGGH
jgi:hypothetical protein